MSSKSIPGLSKTVALPLVLLASLSILFNVQADAHIFKKVGSQVITQQQLNEKEQELAVFHKVKDLKKRRQLAEQFAIFDALLVEIALALKILPAARKKCWQLAEKEFLLEDRFVVNGKVDYEALERNSREFGVDLEDRVDEICKEKMILKSKEKLFAIHRLLGDLSKLNLANPQPEIKKAIAKWRKSVK